MDSNSIDLSDDDRSLLARTALGEASSDPQERAGVISTILNRVGQPGYSDSVRGVIFQPKQFEAIHNKTGGFYQYSPEDYAAARNIVDGIASGNISDPTGGATNFHAASMNPPPKWAQGKSVQQIGATKFYGGKSSDFLSQFEESAPQKSAPKDDFLSQFEQQQAPSEEASAPTARVASAFEQLPATALEPPLDRVNMGVGKTLASLVKQYPEVAGVAAAVGTAAISPELAMAVVTRGIPLAAKGLYHLGKTGLSKMVDYEILSHLLRP